MEVLGLLLELWQDRIEIFFLILRVFACEIASLDRIRIDSRYYHVSFR